MKWLGIGVLLLGVVSLIFGIVFLTQVSTIKAGIGEAQAAVTGIDQQIAGIGEGIAATAAIDPGIAATPPAPETAGGAFLLSSMGTAILAKQVLIGGIASATGLVGLVTFIGITNIIIGIALAIAGLVLLGIIGRLAEMQAAFAPKT